MHSVALYCRTSSAEQKLPIVLRARPLRCRCWSVYQYCFDERVTSSLEAALAFVRGDQLAEAQVGDDTLCLGGASLNQGLDTKSMRKSIKLLLLLPSIPALLRRPKLSWSSLARASWS